MEQQQKYMKHLGFSSKLVKTNYGTLYAHEKKLCKNNKYFQIKYLFYTSENTLFEYHLSEWNKNEIDYFVAINNTSSYIINAKEKANKKEIIESNVVIENFNYGVNTANYEDIAPSEIPFTKEKIDNAFFFDFVLQKTKDIKNEIDTHLLNNLIALKKELSKFDDNNENINALILKSLFIKYFEDRNILINTSLTDTLKTGNPENLKKTFQDISIINGDILKEDILFSEKHINELEIFFTHDYKTYKNTKQQNLFYPYRFDKIPIQLISNIYEEFLGKTNLQEKKNKGVFYTRTFVVDFMLSHTIYPKIKKNPYSTILDPACGSGVFLVQAFKEVLKSLENKKLSIDEKANILRTQIFGVDIDKQALQITAFSLYLTLLDGLKKAEIQKQIEKSKPILPPLIGFNLLEKNTITDDIYFEIEIAEKKHSYSKFDCIVANPPWVQLKKNDANKYEHIKKSSEKIKNLYIYKSVWKYQTSQAFLLKINTFCHNNTDIAIIVNNSNFLNDGAENFRTEILKHYRLNYFYELSNVASILFKGTEYPSAVLILDKQKIDNHTIKYITPRLTNLSKKLRLISYSSKDSKEVKQSDLIEEDLLWKIFVNGNWADYQLIKKIELRKNCNIIVECFSGIKPTGSTPIGTPIYKKRLNAADITQYTINETKLVDFNINQKFDRGRENNYNNIFKGSRILVKRTPSVKDKFRLVCTHTNKEIVFTDHIICMKFKNEEQSKDFISILNSSLFGFYFNQTSSQTNKGKKQSAIKNTELTGLPFVDIPEKIKRKLNYNILANKKELDELIFDLYGLLDFEKEIIREFYQINVERKNELVNPTDIKIYVEQFRESYQLMIKENLRLQASYLISQNIGSVIKFDIIDKQNYNSKIVKGAFSQKKVLQLIKNKQIENEIFEGYINEEKVKIYDNKSFYIIKSNQFKDWTKRQAMDDAKEEIHEILKKLK